MNTSVRVLLDIALRSVALLVLVEAVAAAYTAAVPDDDGLGTGLTAMFALVCAAGGWGLWDGFFRSPVRLCLTWAATGALVSLGSTLYSHLRYGEWSWSVFADDLRTGFVLFVGLVLVPAIVCGILPSVLLGRSADAPAAASRRPGEVR